MPYELLGGPIMFFSTSLSTFEHSQDMSEVIGSMYDIEGE